MGGLFLLGDNMSINRPVEITNWTKFPNCILDNIDKYTPTEFKILAFMVRKNIGYQNPNKQFSIAYLVEKTGMSKPTVINSIAKLIEKGSIVEIKKGQRGAKKYEINWIEPLVKNFNQSKNLTSTSQNFLPVLVKNFYPIKETSKENNTKENNSDKKDLSRYEPLSELLYTEHKKHDEKFLSGKNKNQTFKRWADDIRKLIEIDKRDYSEVERVIKWCQSDGCFWVPNILSGKKLREKFSTLVCQMNRKPNNGKRLKVHDVEGF